MLLTATILILIYQSDIWISLNFHTEYLSYKCQISWDLAGLSQFDSQFVSFIQGHGSR